MRIAHFETHGVPGIAADEGSGLHGRMQPDGGFPGTLPQLIAQGADRRLAYWRKPQASAGNQPGRCPTVAASASTPKILCVGLNYDDHLEESGLKKPVYPEIFARFATA